MYYNYDSPAAYTGAMQLRKYRWSPTYEPSEMELVRLLEARHIEAEPWTAEAGETFAAHTHKLDKRLWCAEGSIVLTIDDKPLSLQAGDALELPAGTVHAAVAGFTGCTCYESPLQAQNPPQPA
jgi:quercetin dioxygenase-like cupin family protein